MNRFIDLPQTVSLLNQERTQQPAVRFAGARPARRRITTTRRMPSLPAQRAERDAGGARFQPLAGDHAGDGVRTDVRAVRLHGDRQLLPANSRQSDKHSSLLLAACRRLLAAGQTRTWTQGEAADFEKGILKNLSLRSDGRLTLAPRLARVVRYFVGVPVGAGAGFQGQPLRRRGHGRQALPDSAGRQGQDAGGPGRARDPRHRHRLAGPRVRGHVAGRQGLPHRRQRQAGSLLRSRRRSTSGRMAFDARGQSVRGHRRPGRDPSRDAGRQGRGLLQDATRRTCAPWRSTARAT